MNSSNFLSSLLVKFSMREISKEEAPKLMARVAAVLERRLAAGQPGVHESDEHAAQDLELFLDNESSLYKLKSSIAKNLLKKKRSGKYNETLAPQAWSYLIEAAAKAYAKEFDSASNWNKLFPKPLRDALAKEYAQTMSNELDNGEWDHLLEGAG